MKRWDTPTIQTAHDVLRRIEVRAIDEHGLVDLFTSQIKSLFLQSPSEISNELRCLAEDSVAKTITRGNLIAYLASKGFRLRQVKLETASAIVSDTTRCYLDSGTNKLIRHALIPRSETKTLMDSIDNHPQGGNFVLTGKAGTGKTGCVIEFVQIIRERGIPVLAFRLDRIKPVTSTNALGHELGLEESPALVLAAAAAGQQAVLVIDQLDAVSTTSGRHADFFDAVESLLTEVRGLRLRAKLHVLVVCRAFDWENDHRLRNMLPKGETRVEIGEFHLDEVKTMLVAESHRPELFSPKQLELLRLPQNLSLFLDANIDPATTPVFNTAKQLFDAYWKTKREAVAKRTQPSAEQWIEVINRLCEEMGRSQQLSVKKEKLDRFEEYARNMASEGVLSFDGKSFSFGHESFFDYCYARAFIANEVPLLDALLASEQHLFRRAQVRQVLVYLRDEDRPRYCAELQALLTHAQIRIHLKDLALALVANVPHPSQEEWVVLEPWCQTQWAAFERNEQNQDRLSELVWRHIWASPTWFAFIDQQGLVSQWLASDNEYLVNASLDYLRFHQRHDGNRVAELLEPYIGQGGDWTNRLRYLMEWADLGNSRRFFDLFLRLIDDGTLDDARCRVVVNGTFWSMIYGLKKEGVEYIPEIMAHWLRRRRDCLVQQADEHGEIPWHGLFGHDDSDADLFNQAAGHAPLILVREVLPIVLEIADTAQYQDNRDRPKLDSVWGLLSLTEHESISSAYLSSLRCALETLAKQMPEKLEEILPALKNRHSYIANYLLLSAYAAAGKYFANEAASLLIAEPRRFDCGYSGSPRWTTMQTIESIFPHCSPEHQSKLENTIIGYLTSYERRAGSQRERGQASLSLLSAIPPEYRSAKAQARFEELKRKPLIPEGAPIPMHSYCVGSPIEKAAAEKMTDAQWLKAIATYHSEDRPHRWEHPEKGGAYELAQQLTEQAKAEPERFARLSLRFPVGTHPAYIEWVLDSLKNANIPLELKLSVCRKAFAESRESCGSALADLLGSVNENLPDEAVEILHWLATQHPNPKIEYWDETTANERVYHNGDILTAGINTTRGRVAWALRDLIHRNADYIPRFRSTLDHLVQDSSTAVRSCVASSLISLSVHDRPLALQLFHQLVTTEEERLLGTHEAERFIYCSLWEHFDEVRPYVEVLLRSNWPNLNQAGARLASLAALKHAAAQTLAAEALVGNASQRLGLVQVASTNLATEKNRTWCEARLCQLFNDEAPEVRRVAA